MNIHEYRQIYGGQRTTKTPEELEKWYQMSAHNHGLDDFRRLLDMAHVPDDFGMASTLPGMPGPGASRNELGQWMLDAAMDGNDLKRLAVPVVTAERHGTGNWENDFRKYGGEYDAGWAYFINPSIYDCVVILDVNLHLPAIGDRGARHAHWPVIFHLADPMHLTFLYMVRDFGVLALQKPRAKQPLTLEPNTGELKVALTLFDRLHNGDDD